MRTDFLRSATIAACLVVWSAAASAAEATPGEGPAEPAERAAPEPAAPPIPPLPQKIPVFSTQAWCADAATLCWEDRWVAFSGLRFLFDVTPGWMLQSGSNRLQSNELTTAMRLGLETNLVKGIWSAQLAIVTPFEAQLDSDSPRVRDGVLSSGSVNVDFGFTAAFGFFDGLLSVGGGVLDYDTRRLDDGTAGDLASGFGFVSLNPIGALRWAIKTAATN
jgi:hypothetical protein